MTNEEKAYEICQPLIEDGKGYYATAEIVAITMAEWKDQQFKELLVNKLASVRDCYQKAKTEGKKDYYSTQMVVIAEIINKLFGGE